jgi:enoyl-CoA hydratase
MGSALRLDRQDTILHIAIDDAKANALSPDVIESMAAAVDDANADPAIAAIVVSGRPGVFSGGFDLDVMRSGDANAVVRLVAEGGRLVRRMYGSPTPIVAACTGHAVAAGALLLLGCDTRYGADGPFTIGLNEVSIGMILPDWAVTIAGARLHPPQFHRAVFTARLTDPPGAVDAGFLDEVVDADELLDAAFAEAARLAALDPAAYRGSVVRFRRDVLQRMDGQIAADLASLT